MKSVFTGALIFIALLLMFSLPSQAAFADVLYKPTPDLSMARQLGVLLELGKGPAYPLTDESAKLSPGSVVYVLEHGFVDNCGGKSPMAMKQLLESRGLSKRGAKIIFESCKAGGGQYLEDLANNLKLSQFDEFTIYGATGGTVVYGQAAAPMYGVSFNDTGYGEVNCKVVRTESIAEARKVAPAIVTALEGYATKLSQVLTDPKEYEKLAREIASDPNVQVYFGKSLADQLDNGCITAGSPWKVVGWLSSGVPKP